MKKFYLCSLFLVLSSLAFSQNQKNVLVVVNCLDNIVPGATMDLNFSLRLINADGEFGDSLALEFPDGVTPLNSPNDPFAPTTYGQSPEAFRGVFGQVASWGDNNDTSEFGGIESNTYYTFKVSVHVDDSVTIDKKLNVHVSGDKLNHTGFSRDYDGKVTLRVGQPKPDLAVDFEDPVPFYYYIPRNQLPDTVPLVAKVKNNGGEISEQAILFFDASSGSYFDGVQLPRPMARDTSVIVNAKIDFLPVIGNVYDFDVYSSTSIDSDPANDHDSALFAVTDTVMSKTDNNYTDSITLSGTGMIGTVFNFLNADTITSLSVFLINPTPGDSLHMELYSMTVAPDTLMGTTGTLIVPQDAQTGWFTLPMLDTLIMPGTSFFVGVAQRTPDKLNMGISPQKFLPGGNFVRNDGFNTFDPAEPLGTLYANSYLIRVNTGHYAKKPGSSVGVGSVTAENTLFSPNPASSVIRFSADLKGQEFIMVDLSGKLVLKGKLEGAQIDVSSLASGTYILQAGEQRFKFVRD